MLAVIFLDELQVSLMLVVFLLMLVVFPPMLVVFPHMPEYDVCYSFVLR